MGDVAVVLKVLPEDSELDINLLKTSVEEEVRGVCKLNKSELQEIGFGLKAIRLEVIVPDEEGKIDKVETSISRIKGVGQVDTEDVTLL